MTKRTWKHVYVVYRLDPISPGSDPALAVTIKEVLEPSESAAKEVERLMEINRDKGCTYACQVAKYWKDD